MTEEDGSKAPRDPLERHRTLSKEAVLSRNEGAIKNLYIELGRDFWERIGEGPDYDVPVLSAPETMTKVVEGLDQTDGLVLDAGCGPNPAVAMELASRRSRSVVILDIGWGMVRTAQAVAAYRGLTLLGVAGDVERLPFRSAVFDGLVCDDTIEHLPNDQAGVCELARVLRPDGCALLATPNRHSAPIVRAKLKDRLAGVRQPRSEYFVASSHLREYTWQEFQRLVRRAFVIDRRRPVGWNVGRKKRALSRVLWLPGLFRVSQMIVLQCRPQPATKSQAVPSKARTMR